MDAGDDLKKIHYNDSTWQLDDSKVYLGLFTRSRLIQEGDIVQSITMFLNGVRLFYECTTTYTFKNLPLNDKLFT